MCLQPQLSSQNPTYQWIEGGHGNKSSSICGWFTTFKWRFHMYQRVNFGTQTGQFANFSKGKCRFFQFGFSKPPTNLQPQLGFPHRILRRRGQNLPGAQASELGCLGWWHLDVFGWALSIQCSCIEACARARNYGRVPGNQQVSVPVNLW